MQSRVAGMVTLVGFIVSVVVANWLVGHYGVVPVGFGLMAPAAVYAVGVAFTLRDLAQRSLGARWVLVGVVVGALLSALVAEPRFALASAVAFGVSEFADFAVYTPLRKKGLVAAVAASNAVGLVVDSLLFLWLAFGSMEFLAGQVVGKAWMTGAALIVLAALAPDPRKQGAAA